MSATTISGPNTRHDLYAVYGWESCYHQGPQQFHFNVKAKSTASWRGYQDTVPTDRFGFDSDMFERFSDSRSELNREAWWTEYVTDFIRFELGYGPHGIPRVYSCGRSGGYLQSQDLEMTANDMIKFGEWLTSQVEWFNSREAGVALAQETLTIYDATKLADMASPRPPRIEA